MKVRVRLFASYAEAAGWREREMEVPDGATVTDVLKALRRGPLMALPGTGRPLFAVNREHAQGDHPVREGDEVGVFPAVSGGSTGSGRTFLTAEPLDARALTDAVRHPSCGAVVVFEGTVRETTGARVVTAIAYEAYEEMATIALERIRAEVEERFPGTRLAMAHRTGRLEVGVTSVVVASAAPHRRDAFSACRLAMDRVKESLPIWKHEESATGSRWI